MTFIDYMLKNQHRYFCQGNFGSFFLLLSITVCFSSICYFAGKNFPVFFLIAVIAILLVTIFVMLVESDSNGYEKISPFARHFFMIIVSICSSYFIATIFTYPLIIFGLPLLYIFFCFVSHFLFVFTFFEPLTKYQTKKLYIFSDLTKNSNKFPVESELFYNALKNIDSDTISHPTFINKLTKVDISLSKTLGL